MNAQFARIVQSVGTETVAPSISKEPINGKLANKSFCHGKQCRPESYMLIITPRSKLCFCISAHHDACN